MGVELLGMHNRAAWVMMFGMLMLYVPALKGLPSLHGYYACMVRGVLEKSHRLRRCARFFCVTVLLSPSGRHVAAWRTRRRLAAKTATNALMVAT